MPVEGRLEKLGLLGDPRVAKARVDDDDARPFQCIAETLVTGRYPPRPLGPGEPGDTDGSSVGTDHTSQVLPGREPHVVKVGGGARRDGWPIDSVDEIDDRDASSSIERQQVVQPIRRDGTKDQAIRSAANAFRDLPLLSF